MARNAFTLLPARLEDVPVLAEISSASFATDVQTEMKSHGKSPFNMKEYALSSLPGELASPKIRIIKAVERDTGNIMGFCTWGFRGVEPPECIIPGGEVFNTSAHEAQRPGEGITKTNPDTVSANDQDARTEKGSEQSAQTESMSMSPKDKDKDNNVEVNDDPIARLEAFTGQDFQTWLDTIMPSGTGTETSCLFIIGLYVSPGFQKRGVGSALLKWGTDLVDFHGVFAWVHSSDGAWRVYERVGFRTVKTLEVDLDEYAPVPAPKERYEGGKWGRYCFRYMVYGAVPT